MTRRRNRQHGYTLVEVMMAIAVLTASSIGIMALQEASVHGNVEARRMSTASQIASSTVEALRLDALHWRQASSSVSSTVFTGSRYLVDVPTTPSATPSTWAMLGATNAVDESAYDFRGVVTTVASDMTFCVQTRYAWLFPGQALRADVRVWWVRAQVGVDASTYVGCPDLNQVSSSYATDLHFVHASTVLRWTPGPL